MKTSSKCYALLLATLLLPLLFNCEKETPKVIPTVTLTTATNITANSASAGGSVTADGGDQVTARGVCWSSTNATPTTSDSKTSDGTGIGSFSSSISGLTRGTTYKLIAYATNSVGTGYSSASTLKTLAFAPTLTTIDLSAVTATSFNSGGNISNDGGSQVTARGVCWSINQNPTITDSKTSDGTGAGSFTSSVTGLTAGTTYYIRAYATNNIGITYGNQLTTKTSAVVPTITATAASSITSTTATSGGNITSDGGATVTARGVCWSTSTGPTVSGSKTIETGTTGVFTSSITGLIAGTTYYVRAYATNSVGTAYGGNIIFTTNKCGSFTIPKAVVQIDGDIADWIGIPEVIIDATNDQNSKANFDGTDLYKFYLAKDDIFLYMLITLYDGPPKIDIHTQYGFEAEQSSEKTNMPGDHLAKAGFSNGRWYAGVNVRALGGGTDTASYPANFVGTGSNFIEWKVRLSDMGDINNKYVWVYIHTFLVDPYPEETVNDASNVCIQLKM